MTYARSRLIVLSTLTYCLALGALAEGALLGRGQFGCVFSESQHLACCKADTKDCEKIQLRPEVDYAVKISNARPDLVNEMKIAQSLAQAENEENLEPNHFFLGVEALCQVPAASEANMQEAIDLCNTTKTIVDKKKKITLSFLPLIRNKLDYNTVGWATFASKQILEIWEHLFKGLVLMGKANVLHLDIKGDNILFDPLDLTHPKFIDFGEGLYKSDWEHKNPRLLTSDLRDLIALIANNERLKITQYRQAFKLIEPEVTALMRKIEESSSFDLYPLLDKLYAKINEN